MTDRVFLVSIVAVHAAFGGAFWWLLR
jgi:hypothetical protein